MKNYTFYLKIELDTQDMDDMDLGLDSPEGMFDVLFMARANGANRAIKSYVEGKPQYKYQSFNIGDYSRSTTVSCETEQDAQQLATCFPGLYAVPPSPATEAIQKILKSRI